MALDPGLAVVAGVVSGILATVILFAAMRNLKWDCPIRPLFGMDIDRFKSLLLSMAFGAIVFAFTATGLGPRPSGDCGYDRLWGVWSDVFDAIYTAWLLVPALLLLISLRG